MKTLVINGPNLNMLGIREPDVYGRTSLAQLEEWVRAWGQELSLEVECFQSNLEGAIIDKLHAALGRVDFVIINPAGYSHTSVALRDAIAAVGLPVIEVHISNIHKREEFRQHSLVSAVCRGTITGLGFLGYRLALIAGRELVGA